MARKVQDDAECGYVAGGVVRNFSRAALNRDSVVVIRGTRVFAALA